MKKVVLAYSGGLDTSVILKWLSVEKQYDVIAVCIDVGQKEDFDGVAKKALYVGAKKVYVVDAKEEFVENYVMKGIQAGALYEQDYLLGTAYARPLIAEKLVSIALQEDAEAIAHGATGKGNDQVRFEAGIKALAPEMKIIAPWREWELKSREDCIDYAQKYHIPLDVTKKDIYSRDENLYHISHEGGELEDTLNPHDEGVYKWVNVMHHTPDIPETIVIDFEAGLPVALNNQPLKPLDLLCHLNKIGSMHQVGVIDIVENRLVGMKSRGVYETPGGTILHEAHQALEKLVHDRTTMRTKNMLSVIYSDLVYDGLWFLPLKQSLDAFMVHTQKVVSGQVTLSLYKGKVRVLGSQSKFSLYSSEHATFGQDEVYNQKDAEGFINLFTLPLKLSQMNQKSCYGIQQGDLKANIYEGEEYESMAGAL